MLHRQSAVATERDDLWLSVAQSAAAKCDRCWHHVEDVGTIAGHEEILWPLCHQRRG